MTHYDEIDQALFAERYAWVKTALGALPEGPSRALRAARAALGLGEGSSVEAMRQAEAAADALAAGMERRRALEVALDAALQCRARQTAEAYLRRLEELPGLARRTLALSGRMALVFDEREAARSKLTQAHGADPGCALARSALAELEYVEGHFAEALALLAPVVVGDGIGEGAPQALRLAAHCYGALGDYSEEAAVLQALVERFPDGVRASQDRLELAFARAGAGDYEAAARELRLVWERERNTGMGRYARRRLDHLETSFEAGHAGRRLEQFPTTHQKRSFCGPAVLELCLRYLGIELGQDEIADVVKREEGTPMFEITAFLSARGILSRRIAATPERLRTAIDLGLPVIVQEEYSTTSHVAVITGYDARLGAFVAQDPMTHRPELKAYEFTENAGFLFGNGGVLVIGRKDTVAPERLALLDASGLVEEPHFTVLDDVDRRRSSLQGEQEDAHIDEVLEACSLALQKAPLYPLAWSRRGWALLRRWRTDGDGRSRGELVDFLQRARTTFRDAEWAHQVHGAYLEHGGRLREAYVEHLQAHRADPGDASNLDDVADCLRRLGDHREAERRFHQALEAQPWYLTAAENLAALYVEALAQETPGAWLDEDAVPFLEPPEDVEVSTPLELSVEETTARARWYVAFALRENPENPFNHAQAGILAALEEDFTSARESFARAAELRDGEYVTLLEARAAYLSEDLTETENAVGKLREKHPDSVQTWLWTAALAHEAGENEAAFSALVDGMRAVGTSRKELVSALWEVGETFGGNEAAAVRLREVVENSPHDPDFVRAVALQVDSADQRGIAIELLRTTLEMEPGDIDVRYRLGRLLAEDPATQQEARELLAEAVRQAPDAVVPRQALAWTYYDSDPASGLEALEPVLEEGDPTALETAGVLAMARGDTERGEELRQRALGSYSTETEGRLELGRYHIDGDRYDLAADLLIPSRDASDCDDLEEFEDAVLTAARLSGRQDEVLDWVKARWAEDTPSHLAWETYWAYRYSEPLLAARAADAYAQEQEDDPEDALEYRIYAAACRARAPGGTTDGLDAIARELGDNGTAWAELYFAYDAAKAYDRAEDAVKRAHRLAPFDLDSLSAWESFCLDEGDTDGAFAAARAALEHHPYQHLGDERLALLFGRNLEVEPAMAHSLRAVKLAPFCHLAQSARAVACFAAGDLEQAERHAKRSVHLEPGDEPDEWDEAEALLRALRGDAEGLGRLLADRAVRRRNWPFSAFDEKLLDLAQRRRV
jgi:tetratricopeptide (TPR) repeat protein